MKKIKFLSVILSVITTLSCTLTVSAELSQEQMSCPDYSQIKSQEINLSEFDNALSRLEQIAKHPDKSAEPDVLINAEILLQEFSDICTLKNAYYLEFNKNVTDNAAYNRLNDANEIYVEANGKIGDCISILCDAGFEEALRDVCGYDMINLFTYIDSENNYSEKSDENEKLTTEIDELINEYMSYTDEDFTAEYEGELWNVTDLLSDSFLSESEISEIASEISSKRNETLGNIYLEILQKRHQLALNNGYDNFAQYAYECLFIRDYSYDETEKIYDFVKEYFSDLSVKTYGKAMTELDNSGLLHREYNQNQVMNIMADFLSEFNSDYLDNFNHMRSHHLYSVNDSSYNSGDSLTTSLYSYSVPYMYVSSLGDVNDILAVAHEFGHANAEYLLPSSAIYDLYGNALDTCEIHSQGMEIMFAVYDNPNFTKDEKSANLKYTLSNMISSITQGCLFDEFQRYAYENPDSTLKQLNEKYDSLCDEYGINYSPENIYEYDWVEIIHNYDSPMYYISYATSAVSALDLWLEAMKNPDNAKEIYKDLCENCSSYTTYKTAADHCGLSTIFDKAAMQEIAYQLDYFFENDEIDLNHTRTDSLPDRNDDNKEFDNIKNFLEFITDEEIDYDSELPENVSEKITVFTILIAFISTIIFGIIWFAALIIVLVILVRSERKKKADKQNNNTNDLM